MSTTRTVAEVWERAPALVAEIDEVRARLAVLLDEREDAWRVLIDGGEQKVVVARAFGVSSMRINQTLESPRRRAPT